MTFEPLIWTLWHLFTCPHKHWRCSVQSLRVRHTQTDWKDREWCRCFVGQLSATTCLTPPTFTPPPQQPHRHTHTHTIGSIPSSWLTLWLHLWNTHCPSYPLPLHTLSLEGGWQQPVRARVCVCVFSRGRKKGKQLHIPNKKKQIEASSLLNRLSATWLF